MDSAEADELMQAWYALHMRTTISLDDRLAEAVREQAAEKGKSVSSFIAGILDDVLKRQEPPEQRPFRLVTVAGGGVRAGVNLDRPRELEIEEDEVAWSRHG
jgi:plasmid stability protein